ncbi:MAG: hypothetical protein LKF41_05375 [Bifidobacterium sp.]|jgi:hypothetical protein|nr:hypothetical protein [Bifidobacterium sp.]MCH4175272.1 hypothetical protein [Bifidobacterium sp.]
MLRTTNKLRFAAGVAAIALLASASLVGTANAVGTGDHNIEVTGQIDSAVVVTLPSGFVLDGNAPNDTSDWVGDNGNLQINTATVAEDEKVVVSVAKISDNTLQVESGSTALAYEVNVNGKTPAVTKQDGTGLIESTGDPVSATVKARFVGGTVSGSATTGDYSGQLTFNVAVVTE